MAFLALSFLFVIIVPLLSYDELKHSLIQTPCFVQLLLTANNQHYSNLEFFNRIGQKRPIALAVYSPFRQFLYMLQRWKSYRMSKLFDII